MASNPAIADYAKNDKFMADMKAFQTREKVLEIKDRLLTTPGMDDLKLQALESMVGITPELIALANKQWDEERAKQQSSVVVEVPSN